MQISPIRACSFKGIAKPYTKDNIKVIPVAKDPSAQDIQDVFETTRGESFASGRHGKVYDFQNNWLLKEYTNPLNAQNEIDIMDRMYDEGIISPHIRGAMYALVAPEGYYVVMNKLEGEPVSKENSPLSPEALKSAVDTLCELDMPIYKNDGASKFPYYHLMHYDLHFKNILLGEEGVGVLDFEHAKFEDLITQKPQKKRYIEESNCYVSDFAEVKSNLREFEFHILLECLANYEGEDRNEIFTQYLKQKSGYHAKRAQFFKERLENCQNRAEKRKLKNLYEREKAHAQMLKNPSATVTAAELGKIQMAACSYMADASVDFIPEQMPCDYPRKVAQDLKKFINTCYCESIFKKNERLYWADCAALCSNWADDCTKLYYRILEKKRKAEASSDAM